MKKFFFALGLMLAVGTTVQAQSGLKNALGGLLGGSSSSETVGNVIDAIGSVVGSGEVKPEALVGTWTYSAPAVSFESDNLLQKAGGAAASQVIVGKIKPYYDKFGVKGMTIQFKDDSTFVLKRGALQVNGTYTAGKDGMYTLNITALGKIPAGKINVYISGNSSKIQITAAADKLIDLVSKVGSLTGNSTIKSVSSVVSSYKGLNIGVEMKKN